MTILKVADFEKSPFLAKYKPLKKSSWDLTSGGTNFSFSFADPENTLSPISVSLGTEPSFITRLGVTFHGVSLSKPARLTPQKEGFLRDLLRSTYPDLKADSILAVVKAEQAKSYDGGSDVMPRTQVGDGASAFVGTVGPDLIVGITR